MSGSTPLPVYQYGYFHLVRSSKKIDWGNLTSRLLTMTRWSQCTCSSKTEHWFWLAINKNNNIKLDLGSIRSSLRYGLSTLYRVTIRNMGDMHLVLPALNLSTLNAGILIMMQQERLMIFSLNMVDYSMSFLLLSTWNFFCWTSGGDHSE